MDHVRLTDRVRLHDAVWVHQLAGMLSARGHAPGPLLARVGLRPTQIARTRAKIPFTAAVALFELAAEAVDDDLLGFRFAQTRDVRDMGLLGYVGLSSPTVLDGLRNVVRYRRVFSEGTTVDIAALETTGELGVACACRRRRMRASTRNSPSPCWCARCGS